MTEETFLLETNLSMPLLISFSIPSQQSFTLWLFTSIYTLHFILALQYRRHGKWALQGIHIGQKHFRKWVLSSTHEAQLYIIYQSLRTEGLGLGVGVGIGNVKRQHMSDETRTAMSKDMETNKAHR